MPTDDREVKWRYLAAWNALISREKEALRISELEFSALSSWVLDCYSSFESIYSDLLRKIDSSGPHDLGLLHECVAEMYFELKHIRNHIEASENGFLELMRVIGEKGSHE